MRHAWVVGQRRSGQQWLWVYWEPTSGADRLHWVAGLKVFSHPRSVVSAPGYGPSICHILMRDTMVLGRLPLVDGATQLG